MLWTRVTASEFTGVVTGQSGRTAWAAPVAKALFVSSGVNSFKRPCMGRKIICKKRGHMGTRDDATSRKCAPKQLSAATVAREARRFDHLGWQEIGTHPPLCFLKVYLDLNHLEWLVLLFAVWKVPY